MTSATCGNALTSDPSAVDARGFGNGLIFTAGLGYLGRQAGIIGRQISQILFRLAIQLPGHERDIAGVVLNHLQLIEQVFLILPRQIRVGGINRGRTILPVARSTSRRLSLTRIGIAGCLHNSRPAQRNCEDHAQCSDAITQIHVIQPIVLTRVINLICTHNSQGARII